MRAVGRMWMVLVAATLVACGDRDEADGGHGASTEAPARRPVEQAEPEAAPAPAPAPAAPRPTSAGGGVVRRTPGTTPAQPGTPSGTPTTEPGTPEATPGTPSPGAPTPGTTRGKPPAPAPAGISQVSDHKWTVKRSLAESWMNNPNALGSARESGAGWQIMGVRSGPAYHLGMRNGDIILEANGHKLDTKPQLLAAYLDLKNDTVFNVTFLRNGSRITNTYQVVN